MDPSVGPWARLVDPRILGSASSEQLIVVEASATLMPTSWTPIGTRPR
jgi:hypothetical protein